MEVLSDMKNFLIDADPEDAEVCVDLLLDASQSRMNSQEMIASQALVIARSFEECHIPVRVTAFRSLRVPGKLVLRILAKGLPLMRRWSNTESFSHTPWKQNH